MLEELQSSAVAFRESGQARLGAMAKATGLSEAYCSFIRRGQDAALTPLGQLGSSNSEVPLIE